MARKRNRVADGCIHPDLFWHADERDYACRIDPEEGSGQAFPDEPRKEPKEDCPCGSLGKYGRCWNCAPWNNKPE